MRELEKRLKALETPPDAKPLPVVLADDAPDGEIDRLRRAGLEVYRLSDAVELFV